MNVSVSPKGSWTVVATIEVIASEAITSFLPRQTREYVFSPAPSSPPGYAWIDISVDFDLGIEYAARVAHSILTELVSCGFPHFRVVAGEAYLHLSGNAFATDKNP